MTEAPQIHEAPLARTSNSSDRVLWITGAGSGMGRAAAVSWAAAGGRVALSGRRADALQETARLVEDAGGSALVLPFDARDGAALASAHAVIESTWGTVTDLVLAAGLNHPRRAWNDQSAEDVTAIVDTNLIAVIRVVDAVLPGMREAGGGTVVVISSYAGWRFTPYAGVAYGASKTALTDVCATLNDQEGVNGIRACHLCPGAVDSDFLALRPNVPGDDERRRMLSPDDVARAIQFVLDSPPHVRINELVITPIPRS